MRQQREEEKPERDVADQKAELGEGLAVRAPWRHQDREIAGGSHGGGRDVRVGGGQRGHATIYEVRAAAKYLRQRSAACVIVLCDIKYLQYFSEPRMTHAARHRPMPSPTPPPSRPGASPSPSPRSAPRSSGRPASGSTGASGSPASSSRFFAVLRDRFGSVGAPSVAAGVVGGRARLRHRHHHRRLSHRDSRDRHTRASRHRARRPPAMRRSTCSAVGRAARTVRRAGPRLLGTRQPKPTGASAPHAPLPSCRSCARRSSRSRSSCC